MVVIFAVKADDDVAFRVTLLGTEQLAPVGAPVHVMVAAPLTPAPPMTSL